MNHIAHFIVHHALTVLKAVEHRLVAELKEHGPDAVRAAEHAIKWAVEEVGRVLHVLPGKHDGGDIEGFDPFDQLKKLFKSLAGQLQHVAQEGVKQVEGATSQGLSQIKQAEGAALGAISGAVETALQAIASEFLKAALKKARALYAAALDTGLSIGVSIQVGPLQMDWGNVQVNGKAVLAALDKIIADGPKATVDGMVAIVRALEPDSLQVQVQGQLALGVGSSDVGVGASVTIPTPTDAKMMQAVRKALAAIL